MARVARCHAKARTLLLQSRKLFRRLDSQLVTRAATLHPFCHRHRLPMDGWHGFHRGPRHRVLAFLELRHLDVMALATSFGSRDFRFGCIGCSHVVRSVTGIASHAHLMMAAQLPVGHHVGSDFAMARLELCGERGPAIAAVVKNTKTKKTEDDTSTVGRDMTTSRPAGSGHRSTRQHTAKP